MRLRWAGNISRMGEGRNIPRILVQKLLKNLHLVDQGTREGYEMRDYGS